MNPFNLLMPDGSPSKVWVCGQCRLTCQHESDAAKCCTPRPCKFCGELTESLWRSHFYSADVSHDSCRTADHNRKEQERLDRAEKLDAWDGWVYCEGYGHEDGYFQSLEDLCDWIHDQHDGEWPEFAYVCKRVPFNKINLSRLIEDCTEDSYEDAADDIKGEDELRKAIDAFNEANKHIVSYETDYKRAVRVPRLAPTMENPPDDRPILPDGLGDIPGETPRETPADQPESDPIQSV